MRVAPFYFPGLHNDRMALKLNGKDDHLKRADFRALADTAGVHAADADAVIEETLECVMDAVDRIAPPELPGHRAQTVAALEKIAALIGARRDSL